jgi:hypothetical protein
MLKGKGKVGSAKFVTGFSRWVKGQAQGLGPVAFKLWVNRVELAPPRRWRWWCTRR